MWAYIDETGNTGNHLFDAQQPFFVTAAMMTRTNFDMTRAAAVASLAGSIGVEALHANELGLSRIESIAPGLLKLLKKADACFFVSRLEKRYLAATKVVDTYFDQGENLAVPWQIYWLKPLRLILTFKIAQFILTEDIAQTVWECVNATSEGKSKKHFIEGATAMLPRVDLLPDARSRQVVSDALRWALENPENFSTYLPDKINRYSHSPNFVAFTILLDGLERTSKKQGRPIREIVHDRQSQFEKTISQWHEVVSRPQLAEVEPWRWPGEVEPISVGKASGSTFRMASEETSAGLQVIDTVLWLLKRVFDRKDIGPHSRDLLNWVFKRAYQNDFSFAGVGEFADQRVRQIMNAELSATQIANGAEMQAVAEENRRKAMDEYSRSKRPQPET